LNAGYISQARFVLRHCRDKAEEVLWNAKYPLTVAYEEAQAIVEEQRKAEEERQRQLAALAVLREEFSDLAALVDDQRLGLPEAIAAGDQRREAARLKAEQEERERLDKIRREREAEEARMAEEERQPPAVRPGQPCLGTPHARAGATVENTFSKIWKRHSPRARGGTPPAVSPLLLLQTAGAFTRSQARKFKIITIIMNVFG